MLNDAANFVSPMNQGAAQQQSIVQQPRILNYSPSPPQAENISADSDMYHPRKSNKLSRPSKHVFQLNAKVLSRGRSSNLGRNRTPQAVNGKINFPPASSLIEESAPTTKLYRENAGNVSERMHLNHDPMSFNCGVISIDDDGNMQIDDSPE